MFTHTKLIYLFLGLMIVMGLYTSASAQSEAELYRADMAGSFADPPNGSPAMGFATLIFEEGIAELAYHVEFQDLEGAEMAAYIWNSNSGDHLLDLEPGTPKDGSTPHGALFGPWILPLINGYVWITIETDAYPGGEISGQFVYMGVIAAENSSWGAVKSQYR